MISVMNTKSIKFRFFLFTVFSLFTLHCFIGCSPSFPKGKITDSLRLLLKKEYKIDSDVSLNGKTLYLNVKLKGLTSTDTKDLTDVLKVIQGAMLTITRVSLSSDAKIEYMVVNAGDEKSILHITLIQRLEDVKGMLYQKISRTDYEGRLILEINTLLESKYKNNQSYDLTMDEFIGRLIVSQVNGSTRNNPFLSVLFNNVHLEYTSLAGGELIIESNTLINDSAKQLFIDMVKKQVKETVKKYKYSMLKNAKIVNKEGVELLTINFTEVVVPLSSFLN
jgi:hypothetical protein